VIGFSETASIFAACRKGLKVIGLGRPNPARYISKFATGFPETTSHFLTLQPRIFGYQSQFRWYSQKFSATNHHFHGVAKNFRLPITISMV